MLGKGGSLPGTPVLGRQSQGIPHANWLATPPESQALTSVRDPASNKMKINEEKHSRPFCCCYSFRFVFPQTDKLKLRKPVTGVLQEMLQRVWQIEKEGQRTALKHISVTPTFHLRFIVFLFMWTYVSVYMYAHLCRIWRRPDEGVKTLWSWSYRSLWTTWYRAGNKTGVLWKSRGS